MIKRYASFLYDIRGDFYGFVRVCSFLFVIFMSFEEILSFLYDHTAQGKKSDQVWECHQGIEDICDVPYSCYSHIWSDEYADDVQPAVCCNCGFVSVEKVFQTSFTVVIPSEDCCECEEYQAQHQ